MRLRLEELRTVLGGVAWTADEPRPVLTVGDLLAGLEVRLLTGEASAELPIRWVHISELLDPTPWMSGGEILLTTGMLLEDRDAQREFITRLADHGLAALGFGTGFRHQEVPGPLLEAAAERGLPVFEVPYELPFIAITEAAFTRLVNEQYAILRRALAALERLERIVLSERGLEALGAALSPLIGASVIVLGARGERLAHSSFRRVLDEDAVVALAADVAERALRRETRVFIPAVRDDEAALALAVAVEEGSDSRAARAPLAWLVAVKDTGPFSDFDRLTLHQAVPLIALELLRARVAGDTERRLAGDVLASLLTGDLRGAEAGRRLAPFGLGEQVVAMVCSTSQIRRVGSTHVADALHPVLRSEAGAAVVARVEGLEYALVPALSDEDALVQADRVGRQLADRLGAEVRIGVGRGVAAAEARRSFNEARCALETLTVGNRPARGAAGDPEADAASPRAATNGNGAVARPRVRVAGHRDIGSFRLLLSLQDDESLKVFCDSILEPLEAADGQYGEELIRSLEAFIDENGQWERAARRLPCHRHTLRYRIRRVEELTGRDLSNARDRIDFWLALRGRELVA